MIQLNLLPDVKLEYIKAQRSRQLVFFVSILVSVLSVALLLVLLSVSGLQKKHLNDLSKDITQESAKLQKEPQITKILTVQNQLESLTALHATKPAASRLFDYLNQVTPTQVDISSFTTDLTAHTATITGTADALSSVNKYIDTLKFTTYKADGNDAKTPAFSNIVLSSFGLSAGTQANGHPANYAITFSNDPVIFDITKKIDLSVPNQVTTRSQVDQPGDLFRSAPADAAKTGGN